MDQEEPWERAPSVEEEEDEEEENIVELVSDGEEDDEAAERDAILRYVWRTMINHHQQSTHEELIQKLQRNRVLYSDNIIGAFRKVPRGEFVLPSMAEDAYLDHPLRFSTMGFNISAPHMHAMCMEALQPELGDLLLDVGSGSGLFTTIAALLVGEQGTVLGLDVREDIVELSQNSVRQWKERNPGEGELPQLRFQVRNCFLPDPDNRKWNCIHVGACCPEYRLNFLIELLAPGGRLVTPYGDQLLRIEKGQDGKVAKRASLAEVRYGDLIVPSEAEVREANIQMESRRKETIFVPETCPTDEETSQLLNNEKFSDFSLIVEGRRVPVHKVVLQSRCEHFEMMFDSGMRESNSSELVIEEFSFMQIMAVLEVVYTGSCEVNAGNAVELLEVADFYKLEWLKCQCEKVLHENIEISTSAQLLSVADRFDAKQLRSASLEFIMKNSDAVMLTDGFKELDRNLVVEVMMEACHRASVK